MARIKYYYDTETCKYERVVASTSDFLLNITGFLILSVFVSLGLVAVYIKIFDSPKELILKHENEQLIKYYEITNKQVAEANEVLHSLQERDDYIYRVIFETAPISPSIRSAGTGGAEKYKELIGQRADKDKLISNAMTKIETLRKQLYVQSRSYDELIVLAKRKEEMLASIPAVQPISNKELRKLASGFGLRIHPIYKVKKFHTGIDFAAVRGTPIYATGDGVARIATHDNGYGTCIEIDHGFGFMTRYGHLDKIRIKHLQKVKRGEVIGYVGSTGTATSPHLHYEVHRNGTIVNPIHYFFNDLNSREYEELIKLSSVENQSLG